MHASGFKFLKAAGFSALTLLAWPAALHAAPALSVGVSDMVATDWQQVVVLHQGPAGITQTISTIASSNTVWLSTWSVPATSSAFSSDDRMANIYTAQVWQPSVQGALDFLDFAIDVRGLNTVFSNGSTGSIRPVIRQGGRVFSAASTDLTVFVSSIFSPLTWHLEDTDTWIDVNANGGADFSSSGGAIEFGYRYTLQASCSSAAGCGAASLNLAVDNFRVDAFAVSNAVPEPGSLALVLCGLLGLPLVRRWSAQR